MTKWATEQRRRTRWQRDNLPPAVMHWLTEFPTLTPSRQQAALTMGNRCREPVLNTKNSGGKSIADWEGSADTHNSNSIDIHTRMLSTKKTDAATLSSHIPTSLLVHRLNGRLNAASTFLYSHTLRASRLKANDYSLQLLTTICLSDFLLPTSGACFF